MLPFLLEKISKGVLGDGALANFCSTSASHLCLSEDGTPHGQHSKPPIRSHAAANFFEKSTNSPTKSPPFENPLLTYNRKNQQKNTTSIDSLGVYIILRDC